jgi:hypothetical protein
MFIVFSNNPSALLYIAWIHGMETKQYGIKILVVTQGKCTYHRAINDIGSLILSYPWFLPFET